MDRFLKSKDKKQRIKVIIAWKMKSITLSLTSIENLKVLIHDILPYIIIDYA